MIEPHRRLLPWAAAAAATIALAAGVALAAQGTPARHQQGLHPAGHAGSHPHGQEPHQRGASAADHGPDHRHGCDPEELVRRLHPEHESLAAHLAALHDTLRALHGADGVLAAHLEALHEALRRHHTPGHAMRHDADAEHPGRRADPSHAGQDHEARGQHHPCHGPDGHDRTRADGATRTPPAAPAATGRR
jgi:hypothetical protein